MTTTAATTYAMRGNGRAIHVATTNYAGELVTLCDTIHYGWNRSKGATRLVKANAATCRKCLAVTNA